MEPTNPNMPGADQPVVPPVQTPVDPNVPAEAPAVPPVPEGGEPAPTPEQPVSNPNPGQWTPPQGGDNNGGTPAA